MSFLHRHRWVLAFTLLAALSQAHLLWLVAPLSPNILAMQLAPDSATYWAIRDAWGPGGLALYRQHFNWDLAHPLIYGAFGYLLAARTPIAPGTAWWQRATRGMLPLAAALDLLENATHLHLLTLPAQTVTPWVAVATALAASKWLLVLLFTLAVLARTTVLLRPAWGTARGPFLLLTPACVALGVALVLAQGLVLRPGPVLAVLLGALAAHVAVNAFNEVFDFRSGLDARTQRTPFSGGSGTLVAHPELSERAFVLALLATGITVAVGLGFVLLRGPALLLLGLPGVALLVLYTTWCAHHPLASLIAPGLGFGWLMVPGTVLALGGQAGAGHVGVWAAATVPALMVSNLLLLNQFPDVDADRSVGRRNLPIVHGRPAAARVFAALYATAYAVLAISVATAWLPLGALAGLLSAPLAWAAARGAITHANHLPALQPAMRQNVLVNLTTPLLMALGVSFGAG